DRIWRDCSSSRTTASNEDGRPAVCSDRNREDWQAYPKDRNRQSAAGSPAGTRGVPPFVRMGPTARPIPRRSASAAETIGRGSRAQTSVLYSADIEVAQRLAQIRGNKHH